MDPERAALTWVWLILLWEFTMKPLYRWVFLALLGLVLIQGAAIYLQRRAWWRDRLTAANQLADASKTERFLRGQVQVATRYIHQGQVDLDRALRERPQTPKAAVALTLEARTDTGHVAAPLRVAGDSIFFSAGFGNLDSVGYRVENQVRIRGVGLLVGQPQQAYINYDVRLAPLNLTVALSCEGLNARVGVSGPRWRDITIASGKMTPEVCNPAPTWKPFEIKAPSLPVAGVLVGIGWVLRDLLK